MAFACDLSMEEQHKFLDYAKEFEWSRVRERVLECPALVNVQPCGRWSALHQAAFCPNAEAVRFLLSCGASVTSRTRTGQTPLSVAKGHEVKSLLRSRSSDSNVREAPSEEIYKPIKAMKVFRAMKTVKKAKRAMKAKAKPLRRRTIAKGKRSKVLVFKGRYQKTAGGVTKDKLMRSNTKKIVSIAKHHRGKAAYGNIQKWVQAFLKARVELEVTGFVALKKKSPLYEKTKELYRN